MNYAKQLAGLKPTKAPSKHRRCTPRERFDDELGVMVKMCSEDMPTVREPLKTKKRKKSSACKQFQWAETKLGRQCVCKATGKRAANRYCVNKAR